MLCHRVQFTLASNNTGPVPVMHPNSLQPAPCFIRPCRGSEGMTWEEIGGHGGAARIGPLLSAAGARLTRFAECCCSLFNIHTASMLFSLIWHPFLSSLYAWLSQTIIFWVLKAESSKFCHYCRILSFLTTLGWQLAELFLAQKKTNPGLQLERVI